MYVSSVNQICLALKIELSERENDMTVFTVSVTHLFLTYILLTDFTDLRRQALQNDEKTQGPVPRLAQMD